tara:strand:+ start:311 stop:586 length:276 start_codon:yes stop_codon:yes gene_type:complete
MNNPDRKEFHIQTILNGLQLVVLTVGVATVFTSIGKKDQIVTSTAENLSQIENIVHELVKAQVSSTTKDGEHDRVLADLKTRIYALERTND